MNSQTFPRLLVGIAVLVVAALGLGYGAARWWRPAPSGPVVRKSLPADPGPEPESTDRSRAVGPNPSVPGTALSKRAKDEFKLN